MYFRNEQLLEEKDRRLPVSKHELVNFPYNCIGRISITKKNSKGARTGTGFLISSSLVLTSAHTFEGLSEQMKSK